MNRCFIHSLSTGEPLQGQVISLSQKRLTFLSVTQWDEFHIKRLRALTSGAIDRDPSDALTRVQRNQYRWARQHGCEKVCSHPWGSLPRFLLQTPLCHCSSHPPISSSSGDSWRTEPRQENDIGVADSFHSFSRAWTGITGFWAGVWKLETEMKDHFYVWTPKCVTSFTFCILLMLFLTAVDTGEKYID